MHCIIVGRDSYSLYFAEEAARLSNTPEAKAHGICESFQDNAVMAWGYFLEDLLPILTDMNCLFQSDLPVPHLLYDKVQTAKAQLKLMCGQTPREHVMSAAEVNWDTPFGAFAESFIFNNSNGRLANHGSSLTTAEILDLKRKWAKCLSFICGALNDRFPEDTMEVYGLIRVIDPVISHSTLIYDTIAGVLKADMVKSLLHIFEVPLYAVSIDPREVSNSFSAFLSSVIAKETYTALYDRKNGNVDQDTIYTFYGQLLAHKNLRNWALFALFMLTFPTGNAISERGFSAMNSTATKGRSSLSIEEIFNTMIISFNGPSYAEFKKILDNESKLEGRKWWGFTPPTPRLKFFQIRVTVDPNYITS